MSVDSQRSSLKRPLLADSSSHFRRRRRNSESVRLRLRELELRRLPLLMGMMSACSSLARVLAPLITTKALYLSGDNYTNRVDVGIFGTMVRENMNE